MIKNCSIWGDLKYQVLKIILNYEHLQNKQVIGIKVALLLIKVGLLRI